MPASVPPQYPDDVVARAVNIRLACFDVDGTLTDGRLIYDSDGRELKAFNATDGLGLKLLKDAGVAVAFITARRSTVTALRAQELEVTAHTFVHDKLGCLRTIANAMGITLDQVAFMGDDLPDLAALKAVGLAVAPADAHGWIVPHVHWRTRADGGRGAARELCDLLLIAQGKASAIIAEAGTRGAQI